MKKISIKDISLIDNNFKLLSILILLLISGFIYAQPANDNFANSIAVTGIINSCSADAAYTTINGTPDLNAGSNWDNSGPKFNVWFHFVAPASGQINVTVDVNGVKGNQRYTQIALWQADGTTEVRSERYSYTTEDVVIGALGLTPGATYYISVDSFNSSTDGTFTLCLDDSLDYDWYEGAIDVTGIINSCSADAAYDTRGGTPDRNVGSNWDNSGPVYNRWFSFTAPASGQINITVDVNGTKGSQRYTQIALWQADGTTEIKSERYSYTTEDVVMGALGLTSGATYYISVDSFNSSTDGTFTLCLDDSLDYDFYEGAIDVTGIINSCSSDAAYDTRGGTPDRNAGSNWDNSGPVYNRWFSFTAPASGQINITVDVNGVKGSQRYTQIAIWQADGITEVRSERYSYTTEDVVIGALGLTPGATYYISVDSFNSSTDGTFTLCLDDSLDYDFYEGAIDVTGIINSCSADATYDTRGGTPDRNAGSNWDNSGPVYNRWFSFTAPASGQINVTVDVNGTKGNQRYTQIAIWQADGTTEVRSERYSYTTEDVAIGALGLTPGDTYYISVDSFNSSTDGTFTLCLEDSLDYDWYEGAIDVTGIINSCSADAAYDTRGGTPDRNVGSNWDNSGPVYNRWFKFTATVTGQINITVDINGVKGNQRYTQIALWEADGTTEIGSEHYSYTTEDVVLGALGLTPGATYYISVDSFNSSTDGTFTLCLDDNLDYDWYEGAIDVTGIINSCSADAAYDTRGGTPDRNAGSNWDNSGPVYNRWFSFIAPASGQINVTVDVNGVKGSQRYTQIAIWQADGVTEIASEHYSYTTEDVVLGTPGLTPGATYYISVDSFNSSTDGTFTLCLDDSLDYDWYEGAIDVTSIINSCSADAAYDTRGGTPDRNAGSNWDNSGPVYNRWFKFTAPASDQINITVDINGVKGNQRYTQIALWEADGTTEVSSTRYQSTNDDVVLRVPGLTSGVTYYISVDSFNSSTDGTFTLCLDSVFVASNDIVINEVLFDQSSTTSATNNDEFIELYNNGAVAVDLAGWQLIDGNLFVNDTDGTGNITGSTTPFTFVCSGSQVCSGSTTLQPGEYAVIWVGSQTASKDATGATFQAWLGQSAKLNNSGDDMWLYDAATTLVDYMAFGANNAINTPPLPTIWDNTYENTLDNTPKGQSISLTPNGVDGNASDCWEPTASGDASARCANYIATVVSDPNLRIASTGETNNGLDTDGDSIADSIDLDDDNDGVLDTIEGSGDPDGDGIINSLDLDSDGDGLPDNVEAQTTLLYTSPNADNLATYVSNSGVNSAYLGGLTPTNTDGADNPDYLDLDSDNEGGNDTTESGLTLAGVDTDGDGLDDATDATADYSDPGGTIDDPLTAPVILLDTDGDANSGGDVDFRDAIDNRPDNDNDGIVDAVDFDDDNDGILDTDEGCGNLVVNGSFEQQDFSNAATFPGGFTHASGTFIGATFNANVLTGWTYTDNLDGWVGNQSPTWSANTFAPAYNGNQYLDIIGAKHYTGNNNILTQVINTEPGKTYNFSFYWGEDVGHAAGSQITLDVDVIDSGSNAIIDETLTSLAQGVIGGIIGPKNWFYYQRTFVATTALTTIQFQATPAVNADGAALDFVNVSLTSDCRDTDNDGVPDAFDLDSDNDGIFDAVEAGHNQAHTNGVVNGAVGTDGIPDTVQSSPNGETTNYTISESTDDTDTIANYLDLDSDGDGIPDNVEAQTTVGYIAPNGIVDANGVDTAYTGGLTPTNTDTVDNPDYLDIDSDNEGANDTIEAGITLANSDTDNDGLDDNTDTTADYSDPGGTIDNPITGSTQLPDIDNDATTGGDVDFRDDIDGRPDNDGDGIVDVIDLDDDNDGIPDTEESQCEVNLSPGVPPGSNVITNLGTRLYTDYSGYWTSAVSSINATRPDNNSNLLAFEMGGQTYATGVPNSRLIDSDSDGFYDLLDTNGDGTGDVMLVESSWTALTPIQNINSGIRLEGALIDGNSSGASGPLLTSSGAPFNPYLYQGTRGLNLAYSIANIGNIWYFNIQGIESVAYGDGELDILLTQVAAPGATTTNTVHLLDNTGNFIGNGVTVNWNTVSSMGNHLTDGYFPSDAVQGANAVKGLRFGAIELSEFNLTPAEIVNAVALRLEISASADPAFFVLNDNSFISNCVDFDTDLDGIPNRFDLDSDNDGILDAVEAGHGQAHTSGVVNGAVGTDGIPDTVQASANSGTVNYTIAESSDDTDTISDYLDLDSDGDGLPDNIEAQTTVGYTPPNADTPATYITNNGINSAYIGGISPTNTDGIDNPDYLDLDSDNEGANDTTEAGITLANSDTDNDGLDDNTDATADYSDPGGTIDDPLTAPIILPDVDNDATTGGDVDFRDAQSDADLSLRKTVNNASPNQGDSITFTLTISNAGPSAPTNIIVKDIIPTEFTYTHPNFSTTQGTVTFNSGTREFEWNLGAFVLGSGNTITLTYTLTVDICGEFTNQVEITNSSLVDPDSTPNNGL